MLLKNYGHILLELLGVEDIAKNNLEPNLQNFIEGLVSSEMDLQCFLSKLKKEI